MLKANVSRNNQIWVKLNAALRPAVLTASGIEVQMVATCHFPSLLSRRYKKMWLWRVTQTHSVNSEVMTLLLSTGMGSSVTL